VKLVIQRVSSASVTVDDEVVGSIDRGLLVLVGIAERDTDDEVRTFAGKVARLRIFPDDEGRMNRSVQDVGGAVLAVSQFTLLGNARKGNRPSFVEAAAPEEGERLCDLFVEAVRAEGLPCETGRFGAHMDVALVNDGPVTILLDSRESRRGNLR
jgi:D-tyrosyl-tRNA(Tyr) deacylase